MSVLTIVLCSSCQFTNYHKIVILFLLWYYQFVVWYYSVIFFLEKYDTQE